MRTKHLFALIHIRNKGKVGAVKHVEAIQYFSWPFQGGASFVNPLWILYVICVSCRSCCSVCSLQPCDHLLWKSWSLGFLVCDVFLCFCHFPIWCPGSGVVFNCIDSWSLPSILLLFSTIICKIICMYHWQWFTLDCFSKKVSIS